MRKFLILALFSAPALFAADPIAQVYDDQVKAVEHDVVRLAEAMPADKYNFAPTSGTFTGVRTFGAQVKHLATIIYMESAAILGEKPPVNVGSEDGPESLKTKAQIVDYLKGSLAYAHKAVGTITAKNNVEPMKSPFDSGTTTRAAAAGMIAWHSFDHYGQMVVYARMNGVVPGQTPPPSASR